jgi:hypothetical protein
VNSNCRLFEEPNALVCPKTGKMLLNGIATPKGVKTTFFSPDINLGKEVHWHINDYGTNSRKLSLLTIGSDHLIFIFFRREEISASDPK